MANCCEIVAQLASGMVHFFRILYPNQPHHPKQKYRLTEKGLKVLHTLKQAL